jgi:TonB family protein
MVEHIVRADALYDARQFRAAIKAYKDALAEHSHGPYAHIKLSYCYCELKEYSEARKEAQAAVAQGPDDASCFYVLAYVFFHQQNYKAAVINIEEAIKLEPTSADSWGLYSAITYSQGKYKDTIEKAQEGLRHDPENIYCLVNQGLALLLTRKFVQAEESFTAALAIDPEDEYAHSGIGRVFLAKGNPNEAFVHLREALRLNPHCKETKEAVVEALKSRNPLYYPIAIWQYRIPLLMKLVVYVLLFAAFGFTTAAFCLFLFDRIITTSLYFDQFGRSLFSKKQIILNVTFCLLGIAILSVAFLLPEQSKAYIDKFSSHKHNSSSYNIVHIYPNKMPKKQKDINKTTLKIKSALIEIPCHEHTELARAYGALGYCYLRQNKSHDAEIVYKAAWRKIADRATTDRNLYNTIAKQYANTLRINHQVKKAESVEEERKNTISSLNLMEDISNKLKQVWHPKGFSRSMQAHVLFYINKNGDIVSEKISTSSGEERFDQMALEAVKNAAPFSVPPKTNEENTAIDFVFEYNYLPKSQ